MTNRTMLLLLLAGFFCPLSYVVSKLYIPNLGVSVLRMPTHRFKIETFL